MISVRSACIINRWRHSFKSLSVRYLSKISEVHQDSTSSEVQGSPNPSNSDSLFGIAPRKLRNVEDEDFAPNYSQPSKAGSSSDISSPQQNYFSQAWAAEKQRPLSRNSDRMEEQLLQAPTAQPSPLQSWTQSRIWLTAPDSEIATQERFVFVSFKVLASANVSKHRGQLYGHVPNQMLDWRIRRKKLIFELELCSPDIICLQEVDRFQDLQSDLATKGYEGIYKVRTGAAPDGCAIFWRKKRFQLLHEESLEFCETGMRDNIAQFCVLKSVASGASNVKDTLDPRNIKCKCVIVGNINVLFNPRRGDMKLGQCRVFLEQAHKLSSSWQGAPLVIGGCFNCTPDSLMYDYLSKGELDLFGLDRRYISGQLTAAANMASKLGTEAKKPGTLSLRETLASLETEEPDRNLSERLRTSLLSRSSSEKDKSVADFSTSAKRILGLQSKEKGLSIDGSKHDSKTEITGPSLFVSKTIEVLEGSLSSNSRHADERETEKKALIDVDVLSSTMSKSPDFLHAEQIDKDTKVSDNASIIFSQSVTGQKQYETSDAKCNQVEGSTLDIASGAKVAGDGSITSLEALVNDKESETGSANTMNAEVVDIAHDAECLQVEERSIGIAGGVDSTTTQPKQPDEPGHGWELDSLKLASGSTDCTVIKHNLKLHSVYTDIQGRADTRDAKGEPLMTMYHRQFRGTVDYIWRSDGLETTKVLDMEPLKSMLVTPGLPSMVHGSDHIALACELSFGDN